jgi:V/A-type H+/Na+-transporting ATPase subunit A
VHPLQSYAEDAREFGPWWAESGNGDWWNLRRRFLTLLDEQARLERMARIIGKDALPARQRLTLLAAELVNEAFLRQSAFSAIDRVCSPARQAAMMRLLGRFIDLAAAALAAGAEPEAIGAIGCMRALQRMGEEIGDDQLPRFDELAARMEREFAELTAAAAPAAATTSATETSDAAHG